MDKIDISIATKNKIAGKVSTKKKIDVNIYPRGPKGEQGLQGLKGEKGDDGNGIVNIKKAKTEGLIDTYTILFSNGSTFDFTVTNANTEDIYSKEEIEELLNKKVNILDIVNELTSDDVNKTLSAKQGKILKELIDSCYTSTETDNLLKSKANKTELNQLQSNIETAIEGKVTNSASENFAGKWNGYMQDIATENTSDTWLLVANKGKVQHRAIANIINSFALPNLGSVANVLDTTITKGFGTYTVNTSNIPSGFFQYGSVLFLPTASSSPNGHIVMLFGNNESANGRIAIAYCANGEFTGWNYIKTRNNITTGTEIATNEYLDNKQIYQKTIKITSLNTGISQQQHGISNFGELIDIYGTGYWSVQGWQPIQRVVTDNIGPYRTWTW